MLVVWCLGGLVVGWGLAVLGLLVVRLVGGCCGDFRLGLLLLIVLFYLLVGFDSFYLILFMVRVKCLVFVIWLWAAVFVLVWLLGFVVLMLCVVVL